MKASHLIMKAREAKELSYSPYSNFAVGAAIETEDGSVYTGCNVEIASFAGTLCAERNAVFKAVSEGHRKIEKIAVVSNVPHTYPCGICRQVIREFAKDAEIYVAGEGDEYSTYTLEDLLPHSFGPEFLNK
ncbi:MAG: cytidine deaminase [Tissierellia bacterium]|nr:cytidine deaminase [Tissierellia bacterium]